MFVWGSVGLELWSFDEAWENLEYMVVAGMFRPFRLQNFQTVGRRLGNKKKRMSLKAGNPPISKTAYFGVGGN